MTEASEETARAKVVRKYNDLYICLTDLVDALQVLEPGGTLLDDVVIYQKEEGKVSLTYVATPLQLTIQDKNRKFILRVIETS